jgi:hypothetical protein
LGPLVIQPERSTSPTAAMVASSMVGLAKGRNGSEGRLMVESGQTIFRMEGRRGAGGAARRPGIVNQLRVSKTTPT